MVKKKKIIIAIVLLIIVLAAGGYFYWQWSKNSVLRALEKNKDALDKIIENSTQGTLPSLNTNPLENKPNINPADAANPIKNIKTNPFD